MLKQTRREFLRAAGIAGSGMSRVLAADKLSETKPRSRIRVAQIRVYPQKGKLQENHARLIEILAEIEEKADVDVLVTPEGFLDGYVVTEKWVTKDDLPCYAIDPDSSVYTRAVSDWAKRNNVWVIYGCARKAEGGVYNTALIYNRKGALVGMYDKTHIQTHDHKYLPGKHLDVYESDFGLFGVMICADRRWPETSRTLTLKGARVIFNPTYGMHGDLNLCMMRTRAYENGIFIVFTHPGQSLITGPNGAVVCNDRNDDRRYIVTEIDLSKAPANTGGHIVDRRPDLYRL
ncbi:MAG: carbon-nitrogen hydrolase family protein [Phycisphaerales bacterium]|nr:MAG: carbon-nitrogen hydrolase family protein [Phycisphaerales bacterium]